MHHTSRRWARHIMQVSSSHHASHITQVSSLPSRRWACHITQVHHASELVTSRRWARHITQVTSCRWAHHITQVNSSHHAGELVTSHMYIMQVSSSHHAGELVTLCRWARHITQVSSSMSNHSENTHLGSAVQFLASSSWNLESKVSIEWSQVRWMKHHFTPQVGKWLNSTFNRHHTSKYR